MNSFGFNFNKRNGKRHADSPQQYALNQNARYRQVRNPYSERRNQQNYRYKAQGSAVISGYFVQEKSYKEIIIARINTTLCAMLACLVLVCLVSYYFVVVNEMQLQKLNKETIALNLDNAEMQNKLDNLQSFSNVDFQVSRTNILQRAKQVIELSAADLPNVNYDKKQNEKTMNWSLGY